MKYQNLANQLIARGVAIPDGLSLEKVFELAINSTVTEANARRAIEAAPGGQCPARATSYVTGDKPAWA